ncbi:MAG: hypothetical protein AB1746_11070 [Candidatus Zixiibacteriota bacterium]
MEVFGTWLAAFFTLGIISFLYKDNPWYKLSEAVFVGISAGYWFVVSYWDNLYGKLYVGISVNHDYMLLVGAILGIMMILRLIPSIGWISRWPLAFIVGAIAGLYLMNYFSSNVMAQVQSSIMPFFSSTYGDSIFSTSFGTIVANIVVVVGTFTGLVYFYFSKEHVGAFGGAAKVGIWVIMITFGASFGYTVMSRMSLLIGRMDFIFGDWLGMIQ